MGASKRIMEDLVMAYNKYFKVNTARFANVAFSNGSLPDGLEKDSCSSDDKAKRKDDNEYPTVYFGSDTTGEKAYEKNLNW